MIRAVGLSTNLRPIDPSVKPTCAGLRLPRAAYLKRLNVSSFAEGADDFSGCALCSLVAWDPVSWPGNDFFSDSRATDHGVKAAATNSMSVFTGVDGQYDSRHGKYRPPPPYGNWEAVVEDGIRTRHLRLWNPLAVWQSGDNGKPWFSRHDPHGGEPRRIHRSKDGRVDWLETSDEFVGGDTMDPGFVEAFLETIRQMEPTRHTLGRALYVDGK
jgi:hypothetical protein